MTPLFHLSLLASFLLGGAGVEAVSRTSYVQSQLLAYNQGLSAAQRLEKYTDMNTDVFAFYRGTNHLFWSDLGNSTSLVPYGNLDTTRTWLSGDMHVENIGAFSNDGGTVVYDLNDFDEAVIADYQLDLWRMGVSIVLLMLRNGGFSANDRLNAVQQMVQYYFNAITSFQGTSQETSDSSMFTAKQNSYGLLDEFLSSTESNDGRAAMLQKWTSNPSGSPRVFDFSLSDLGTVTSSERTTVTNALSSSNYGATLSGKISYSSSYFKVKDVAQRLHAGLGSLGATRYYVLIEGPSSSQSDDVILDLKAQPSVPSPFRNLNATSISITNTASGGGHTGKRIVTAAKALGLHVDDYLGYTTLGGIIYTVRERNPYKETFDDTQLTQVDRITNMAQQWGTILATAHARADKDVGKNIAYDFDKSVYALTTGKVSSIRTQVANLAASYAAQVTDDFNSFRTLFASGVLTLPSEEGVTGIIPNGAGRYEVSSVAVGIVGLLSAVAVEW